MGGGRTLGGRCIALLVMDMRGGRILSEEEVETAPACAQLTICERLSTTLWGVMRIEKGLVGRWTGRLMKVMRNRSLRNAKIRRANELVPAGRDVLRDGIGAMTATLAAPSKKRDEMHSFRTTMEYTGIMRTANDGKREMMPWHSKYRKYVRRPSDSQSAAKKKSKKANRKRNRSRSFKDGRYAVDEASALWIYEQNQSSLSRQYPTLQTLNFQLRRQRSCQKTQR